MARLCTHPSLRSSTTLALTDPHPAPVPACADAVCGAACGAWACVCVRGAWWRCGTRDLGGVGALSCALPPSPRSLSCVQGVCACACWFRVLLCGWEAVVPAGIREGLRL